MDPRKGRDSELVTHLVMEVGLNPQAGWKRAAGAPTRCAAGKASVGGERGTKKERNQKNKHQPAPKPKTRARFFCFFFSPQLELSQ